VRSRRRPAGLREEYGIEVPVWDWNETPLVRVSVQGYNTATDLEALVEALPRMFSSPAR
jgi:selenocysteine lyase/cysteine desulfurase